MPLHNIDGRRIRTTHEFPPIPLRKFDWSAIDADTYDAFEPIGFGTTEDEAIADLLAMLEEDDQNDDAF